MAVLLLPPSYDVSAAAWRRKPGAEVGRQRCDWPGLVMMALVPAPASDLCGMIVLRRFGREIMGAGKGLFADGGARGRAGAACAGQEAGFGAGRCRGR